MFFFRVLLIGSQSHNRTTRFDAALLDSNSFFILTLVVELCQWCHILPFFASKKKRFASTLGDFILANTVTAEIWGATRFDHARDWLPIFRTLLRRRRRRFFHAALVPIQRTCWLYESVQNCSHSESINHH